MLKNKSPLALLLFGLLFPGFSAAEEAIPLSLESSILFALDQNPSVKAEMEKIKQAHIAIDEARSAYYPQVNLSFRGGHEYAYPAALPAGVSSSDKVGKQVNPYDAGIVVNQILFNGFATDEEVYRRMRLEDSASYASLVTIEGILQDAIQYYVLVWRYQRAFTESQQFVNQLQAIGEKIRLMNAAGAESKAKKEYVDSRVAAAQTELNRVKASYKDALSNLESLTGKLPPFMAQRPLQFDPTVRPIESYYETSHKENNRLLLNKSDHAAVEHWIKETQAAYLPTVSLQVEGRNGYNTGGHVGSTWNGSAMVVVDYKLFDGFSKSNAESRMKSQKLENEFRQIQLERDVDKEIRKSYNKILAIKQELASNIREILSSESLQELYKKQFELGEGDIITMIEGAERLHSARQNSFGLESNIVLESYSLLQKVGSLRKERFCQSC
ncbi:MAG: TolC family protein [Alphaproteobacteria bacterium]|nr:TolC family protein [Alphaproteobacteria bacterium]